jgi:hypothetical protein
MWLYSIEFRSLDMAFFDEDDEENGAVKEEDE